jgi:hypothetical protein
MCDDAGDDRADQKADEEAAGPLAGDDVAQSRVRVREHRDAGDADQPFASAIRSSQQRLANGNTLITESNGGRILEVTRQGETVWEFVNPERGGASANKVPIVCWAERYSQSYFVPDFLQHGRV